MKLRHRFALTFAAASLGSLLADRLVTYESFRQLQQYELDSGLLARARDEGNEMALLGRKTIELEGADSEDTDPLDQLVTYGALYRADGSLIADTPSFAHAPSLGELGPSGSRTPGVCFDFRFRDKRLRGVLVEVSAPQLPEARYFLLAASRRGIDSDTQQLLAIGWWVVVASMPFAVALGWWLGRRMTRDIETLVTAAGRVTAGELELPRALGRRTDAEVEALGVALRDMVKRLRGLIETEQRFAAHAAHELRSPLSALRGELELALRRERSAPEYASTLRDALDDTNRLITLAEDLLVVSRLQSGAIEDASDTLEIGALIEQAVSSSRARGEEASQVVVEGERGDARVRGSHTTLLRMVRNLVDNAVVHGKGAPVRVRVRRTVEDGARYVCVDVEDDGPGIGDEDAARVFEPFHRGADARIDSGAGLGLGIAREIARTHDGDIELDSRSSPTRFVVRLPEAPS